MHIVWTIEGAISKYQFLSKSEYIPFNGMKLKIECLRFALTNRRMIPVLMKEVMKMEIMIDLTYSEP
jgi:hypothetical protein